MEDGACGRWCLRVEQDREDPLGDLGQGLAQRRQSEDPSGVGVVETDDADVEAGETLLVAITTAPSGGMWIAYDTVAAGEIRNDDFSSPPPATTIFADGFELGSTALWSNTVP